MHSNALQNRGDCPQDAISMHLDGELSPAESQLFESHLASCEKCQIELNSQKKLLSVLGAAFENPKEIILPKDFTKIVVTNAESKVCGLRSRKERNIAIFICCVGFLILVLGLGGDTERFFGNVVDFGNRFGAVIGSAFSFIYDFTTGLVVLLRCISSRMIFNSGFSVAAVFGFAVLAFLVLSRLLNRFGSSQNEQGEFIQ